MHSIEGKKVFITGASSGIGEACAFQFAQAGADLLICARRMVKLNKVAEKLKENYDANVFTFELDVRRYSDVKNKIENLPEEWKEIDILVNNAGLARAADKVYEYDVSDWDEMIDTNIKGLLYVTRLVVSGMVERGAGHIINIGSTAGHESYMGGGVYCGTKHFIDAVTKGFKLDLLGTGVRISSVAPGMVETEFSLVRFHGNEEKAANVYKGLTPLTADDVADAVLYCATRPPHVNINEIILTTKDQGNAFLFNRQND